MKLSLLEMVQSVLNDIDGEPVNSISDTVESEQIAQIIKDSYLALVSNRNWPHTRRTIALNSFGDNEFPTHMVVPEDIKELETLNYNKKKLDNPRNYYEPVEYLYPDQFLHLTNNRDTENENVDVITDVGGVLINIETNVQPTYYTSFDDKTVVFDSYDKTVETTLQSSNTQAVVVEQPTFSLVDNFVPSLPVDAFSALLEESKSAASLKLRQMADAKSEQRAQQQRTWLDRQAFVVNGGVRYPDYSRRGRGASRAPLLYDSPRFQR